MTSPINPILVIRNNLPEWKRMLLEDKEHKTNEIECIDIELATIAKLEAALNG